MNTELMKLITSAVESAVDKMDAEQLRTLVTDAYLNPRGGYEYE